ncbi:MAG: helix-turn-helix transcriptional regulator [Pelotomaculum sp.]|nr:helix-turn-helix transcriptional regulator [Pelotomaculum sp.]
MFDVGRRITDIRTSQGISLTNLAKRSGIAQSSLSYIESGKAQPTVETVHKICAALGITLAEFFADHAQEEELPADIKRMIAIARRLTPRQRKLLLEVMEEWLNQTGM